MRKGTALAIALVLCAIAAFGVWRLIQPWVEEYEHRSASDAGTASATTVRIGGDRYLGYFFLNSPDFKKEAVRNGLAITFADDNGAYAERMKKFAAGEYDMIVLPVGSYVEHGASYNYPGVLTEAIAESRGADGIVAFSSKVPNGNISDLNRADYKFVYTKDSPSDFLVDFVRTRFELDQLAKDGSWQVEMDGIDKVYEKLKRRDGDVFVLWEPYLSKALKEFPDLKYVWGSDQVRNLIIDGMVFHRDLVRKNPKLIETFLDSYFRVLQGYGNDRPRMIAEMADWAEMDRPTVQQLVENNKIEFFNLWENANQMFGVQTAPDVRANEGVLNAIIGATSVLVRSGHLTKDPLEGQPYSITNASFIKTLVEKNPASVTANASGPIDFAPIDDKAWGALPQGATLKIPEISFDLGGEVLDDAGKEQVDALALQLTANFPQSRFAVRGHTGPGDEAENQRLSLLRAQLVTQRMIAVHGIDPDRVHAEGYGSTRPLPKRTDESERAYRYRLPRVEIVLLRDNSF